MAKKTLSAREGHIDAVEVLKQYLREMYREGRFAYVDESTHRVYRPVDGQLVEVTSSNAHLFPEPVAWSSITVTDDARHES